ncbi:MAG: translocation/assembly module TamB domain-containing protein [Cyclobacteriaceae bacterium]
MKRKLIIGAILSISKKVILWFMTIVLLLFAILFVLAQTKGFQNYAVSKVLALINESTNQETTLAAIKIQWLDKVEISGLQVKDYNDQLLIGAEKLVVDYDLFDLLSNGQINFDGLTIENGGLHLIKYDDDLAINIVEFLNVIKNSLQKEQKTKKEKGSSQLRLDQIELLEFDFSYFNHESSVVDVEKFNFSHFSFHIPKANLDDFKLFSDTILTRIERFSAIDSVSGFHINSMTSSLELSNHRLLLQDLDLSLQDSKVSDRIVLKYSGLNDLSTFVDSVGIEMNLNESYLGRSDLKFFAEVPENFPVLFFDGHVSGSIPDISADGMKVGISEETYMIGDIDLFGLPNVKETFILLSISEGICRPKEIGVIIKDMPEQILKLGKLSFSGQFSGFLTDFVARASIKTREATIVSDLNLKFPLGWQEARYSGKLKVTNFNAGAFLNKRELIQVLNFEGIVKGSGLTFENAELYTEAKLTNSGFYGYVFDEIEANGKFSSRFFEGSLNISDPHGELQSFGSIDLKQFPEQIKLHADIKRIDFKELGLTERDISLKGKVDFSLSGLNIDSLNSASSIRDLELYHNGRKLEIDSLDFVTENQGTGRRINFSLPEIEGEIKGNFYYTEFANDAILIWDEVIGYFTNSYSSAFEKKEFKRYGIDFSVVYGNLSRYFDFMDQNIYVSPDGEIEGTYSQRKNAMLTVFAYVDSINYQGIGLSENNFDVNIIKDLDSLGIIAVVNFNSDSQDWGKVPRSSDLVVESVWQNNELTLYSHVVQPETNSKATINAILGIEENNLLFRFLPSEIQVLGKKWSFNTQNQIEYANKLLTVKNLDFHQNAQTILIEGIYSKQSDSHLNVNFENFSLETLNTIIPFHLDGKLDGMFRSEKKGVEEQYHFISDLSIDSLIVNEYFVGDMEGISMWEENQSRLHIDLDIIRESINTISVDGYYYVREQDPLDVNLRFEEANLKVLAPFFENSVSNLEGLADGQVKITGALNYPILNGKSSISQGAFTYDYLGVSYSYDGRLSFNNEAIILESVSLKDKDGNLAVLDGSLNHKGFTELKPSINIKTDKFLFLNTSSLSEEIYYGNAYASGIINVSGSQDDLIIKAKIKSEKGTRVFFPLEDDGFVEQKEYISFVDLSDSTQTIDIEEVIQNSITGVTLDFELEITPDAYIELIFDLRAGDIIRGSGSGNLNLILDTNGQFELLGDVNITEGAYNFTTSLAGTTILSKEFKIEPGSTISWFGDPYKGVLDLEAVYRQFASLSDLNPEVEEVEVSQRVPVLVVLSLNGEMLSPEIGFEIKLDDSQSLASASDNAEIRRINDDEQQLKRQVFSLLMLRNFSPKDHFSVPKGGQFTSLSEFVTNQLSYYASQVNENLEVDLDLATLDDNALNNLQLRLSYTFLDGRLRVSGGGGFNQNTLDETAGSSFVGDWSVQYLLTSDGRLRAKAFRQADQVTVDGQQSETGVSVQVIKSFDDFKQLIPKARKNAVKESEKLKNKTQ